MSDQLSYPVPWREVFGLWRNIKDHTRTSVDRFTSDVAHYIQPPPVVEGALPADPRFVLAANHYQRKGLWILHTAAALTRVIRERYGEGDPPVRWMVTANWPPVRVGPWSFPSPGDWLLPRVANALDCYPVSFAGSNPQFTARTLRKLLRDARTLERPIGIFPEGAAGVAGVPGCALPGVGRLLRELKLPIVPVGVKEGGRLILRFGDRITQEELTTAQDPARMVMERIQNLVG